MASMNKLLILMLLLAVPGFAMAQGRVIRRGELSPGAAMAVHEPFVEPITAKKIRTAIDDAVMFLRSQQLPNGSIGETSNGRDLGGPTALATLAMLAAGGHPASDDQLKQALDWLAKIEPNNTYVRGIRANVWEYALRKVPYDQRIRELLKADFEWLLAALGDRKGGWREGWRYQMESTDWDNSCTQYGVLGIWAAARAGFEPGDKFWITMSKHFRNCQNADGGWSYTTGASTPNMATAGLASMFLVFDMYHGKSFYSAESPRTFTEGDAAEVLASIERGMTWLGNATGNKNTAYYLYGIERTGVAGGRKTIGGEDWFAGGSLTVLKSQLPNGMFPLGRYGGPVVGTSFCTLFLVYGGAPVAIEKLQYGDGHDWNLNPRDLANLSKHLWSAYERPLNWQTVSIRAKAEEFEAPILFISGSKAVKFGEEEMLKLREYVLRGGTILAEPTDRSRPFAESIERLVGQMFPAKDYPACKLEPLPAEHGIYTVLKQPWKNRPRLRGATDGSRTFLLLSGEYLSADWQVNRTDSDAFRLAMNLLFYATDLGTLQGKFASILPDTPAAKPRETEIKIARVKFSPADAANPRDWNAATLCWQKYAPYAMHVTGGKLVEVPPVSLGTDDLKDVRLLHLTGRHRLHLSDAQRAALKKYVDAGGTLLVDAYAGSSEFATSARGELEAIFGTLEPLPADHLLAEGRFEGGADLSDRIRLKLPARQLLRRRGEESRGQKLLIARVKNRPAVIYSEFDLSAAMAGIENYRSLGYKPASARKIVGNLLAFVTAD
ncbi:MAG: DUF4159 domain-containing protein [Candidatus Nealsonbacteria bacterium]|nr:DUF4159 domain-containing protein [Candidatus Nealsonbacteria bacterium]